MIACLRRRVAEENFRLTRTAASLVLVLTLTACGITPPEDTGAAVATPVRTAESLSRQGRHEAAADLYRQLAQRADGELRQRYLILMARERHLAGTPEFSRTILSRLGDVAESNRLLWAQVAAEVAISLGEPERALASLDAAPPATAADDAINMLLIRSNALFRLGRPVAATLALLEREVWLDNPQAIAANQRMLWEAYRTWGVESADDDARPADDPTVNGWLALGEIAWTRRTAPAAMRMALRAWQAEYPSHPANRVLIPDLLAGLPAQQTFPRQVGLLLPLTGRQRQAATAVRDGFLAAHFTAADMPDRPAIRIYDVAGPGVEAAYREAVADGATFVVGPLLKESVQQLADSGITAPTLTLNYLPGDAPAVAGLYQFGLSPEDEAQQIAQRAAALGQSRALALAPNNPWGRRLLNSFVEEFQARGGSLLDYRFYDPGSPDFSAGIQQLLLIDESRARQERLSANLGIPLTYEPRRRSDVDLIFLAATEQAGKLIRPQLRFHYAGAVPTYSTSAIYQEGTRNNADLDGIMFPDIPWVIEPDGQSLKIRESLATFWPAQAKSWSRLYALGFDAYRLIPTLNSDAYWRAGDLPGMTGTLYIDEDGRIWRRLAWARIRLGRPELMAPAPQAARPSPGPAFPELNTWPDTSNPVRPPND